MANGQTDRPEGAPRRREELLARREAQRRARRRAGRRRLVVLLVSLVGVAAVAVVVTNMGGNQVADKHRPGLVRNATPQPNWTPHTGPVPILEYHVLGAAPSDARYPELFVTRPDFRRQLNWLARHGYQAVTLETVERAWYHGGTLPAKPVVLSFDDGYRPQFTFALPQLRRHGWPGVLNLKAEGSDLYGSNVRAMIAAGWELAAHTIHHLDLTKLDPAALKEEVAGSRAILRREYGVPVENFCYPAGEFDRTVVAAVKAAGYTGATTEIRGYADSRKPFELDRFEILGSSGVAGLAADLASH
jgi:peptidoglycan/xylan/chitin deacetylase (PgdA/CDA1 family)